MFVSYSVLFIISILSWLFYLRFVSSIGVSLYIVYYYLKFVYYLDYCFVISILNWVFDRGSLCVCVVLGWSVCWRLISLFDMVNILFALFSLFIVAILILSNYVYVFYIVSGWGCSVRCKLQCVANQYLSFTYCKYIYYYLYISAWGIVGTIIKIYQAYLVC